MYFPEVMKRKTVDLYRFIIIYDPLKHVKQDNTVIIICHYSVCVIYDLSKTGRSYLLTNWLAYLYGRIQSPRPDVMPDRREGITRAAGFVLACIDTQAS